MNRQKFLLIAALLLVAISVAYSIWSGWGLVTVEVKGRPLSEVMRSIEKQAGIVLKTNMDTTRPVTMHVRKVPLTEALETLASVMDSRWRVGYVFGPDSGTVKSALDTISAGQRPEGWKNFDVPMFGAPGGRRGDGPAPMDPRRDVWNVKEPAEKTLHGFLQGAATGVSASFLCPEAFNPAVGLAPGSGPITKAAPALAKNAGAKMEEVFLLMGRPAGVAVDEREEDFEPGGPPRRPGGGPGGGRGGRPPDFAAMRERQFAEIEKLPKSEQAAARAEFEEREQFFTSVRDLPEDQRRAKMEEFFNRPEIQDRMERRRLAEEERKTPGQRLQRYERYVQRKQEAIQGKAK